MVQYHYNSHFVQHRTCRLPLMNLEIEGVGALLCYAMFLADANTGCLINLQLDWKSLGAG